MIAKDIAQISEADLQPLINNSVLEGKTIEYKKSLPSNSDKDKKEFLADVSSFANASGGDLIIGISEDNGLPKSLVGIDTKKPDDEITRLDSIIRDGIEPRLPSVIIQPIPISNAKTLLLIRIAKSWISPHRVTYKSHDKFYSRSSNGKYSLDVSELRIAFTLSATITEKIRRFREDRISKIYANETPMPLLEGNAKIILHLIPIISFNPAQQFDIQKIASQRSKMPPICCSGWSSRYNLDGFMTYSEFGSNKTNSYTQVYRNGIIEAVEGFLFRPHNDEGLYIPSIAYEEELIEALNCYIKVMKIIEVEPPMLIFLTLVGVKGYYMGVGRQRITFVTPPSIDREILLLPEVIIENYDIAPEKILKPCFDAIWNACGYSESLNYDDDGNWKSRR